MVRMSQLSGWKLQFFDRWPGAIGICLDLILAAALDCEKNGIPEIYIPVHIRFFCSETVMSDSNVVADLLDKFLKFE